MVNSSGYLNLTLLNFSMTGNTCKSATTSSQNLPLFLSREISVNSTEILNNIFCNDTTLFKTSDIGSITTSLVFSNIEISNNKISTYLIQTDHPFLLKTKSPQIIQGSLTLKNLTISDNSHVLFSSAMQSFIITSFIDFILIKNLNFLQEYGSHLLKADFTGAIIFKLVNCTNQLSTTSQAQNGPIMLAN